jgi:hypothetical protein
VTAQALVLVIQSEVPMVYRLALLKVKKLECLLGKVC